MVSSIRLGRMEDACRCNTSTSSTLYQGPFGIHHSILFLHNVLDFFSNSNSSVTGYLLIHLFAPRPRLYCLVSVGGWVGGWVGPAERLHQHRGCHRDFHHRVWPARGVRVFLLLRERFSISACMPFCVRSRELVLTSSKCLFPSPVKSIRFLRLCHHDHHRHAHSCRVLLCIIVDRSRTL